MPRWLVEIASWAPEGAVWWAVAVGVSAAVFVVALAVRRVAIQRVEKIVEAKGADETQIDEFVLAPLRAVHALFLLALALYVGAAAAPLPSEIDAAIDTAMVLAALVQGGQLVQRVLTAAIGRWLGERKDAGSATLAAGLRFAAQLVIWVAVALLVLANLGVEITALVAGLGVGGVAAALAVQNVLGDLFSSLAIYFDRPFDIGDFVVVGTDLGTVTRIGLRSTRVTALTGEEIVFPNANLAQSRIHNFRRMTERRVALSLGVVYGTSADALEEAARIVREAIEGTEGVRLERSHFKGFGASSLDLEAVYWVLDPDYNVYMDRQQAINLTILRRFEAAGLELAFPTQTLHVASVDASLIRGTDR